MRLAGSAPVSRGLSRALPAADAALRRLGSRHSLAGLLVPVGLLTTTGRRSGRARAVPLLVVPHAQGWGVVASNFGATTPPQWFLNLRARADAVLEVDGIRHDVVAEELSGDDRAALRRTAIALYPGFRTYEARAGRTIPYVLLRRRSVTP